VVECSRAWLREKAVRLAGEAAKSRRQPIGCRPRDRLVDLGIVLRPSRSVGEAVSRLEQALRLYERKGNLVGARADRALARDGQPRSSKASKPSVSRCSWPEKQLTFLGSMMRGAWRSVIPETSLRDCNSLDIMLVWISACVVFSRGG